MKRDPRGVSNPTEVPYLNAKKFPIFATSAAQVKAQGWVCRVAARRQRRGHARGWLRSPRSSSEPQKIEFGPSRARHRPQPCSTASLKDLCGEAATGALCGPLRPLGEGPGTGSGAVMVCKGGSRQSTLRPRNARFLGI